MYSTHYITIENHDDHDEFYKTVKLYLKTQLRSLGQFLNWTMSTFRHHLNNGKRSKSLLFDLEFYYKHLGCVYLYINKYIYIYRGLNSRPFGTHSPSRERPPR